MLFYDDVLFPRNSLDIFDVSAFSDGVLEGEAKDFAGIGTET